MVLLRSPSQMTPSAPEVLIAKIRAEVPDDPRERGLMFLHAAVSLVQMDKSVDAFRLFDEVVTEMDGLPTSDTREQALSMALYNKGVILGQMGRIDEELAAYDALAARFS